MSNDVKRLIEIIESQLGNLTIISYGLAPNPNGFCYELIEPCHISESELINFIYILNNLSSSEENTIKEVYLN